MNRQIFKIFIGFLLVSFLSAVQVNGQQSAIRQCDDSHAPVVFVHGFLGSGDTWAPQVQRFASNGLCADVPIRTIAEETWVAEFNGRKIPVRNWSSKTDGVTIAVFW